MDKSDKLINDLYLKHLNIDELKSLLPSVYEKAIMARIEELKELQTKKTNYVKD